MVRQRTLAALLAAGLLGSGASAVAEPATPQPERAQPQTARTIDWYNATFTVPPVGPCHRQTVTFQDGAARTPEAVYRFTPGHVVAHADVTGEGVLDALFLLDCGPPNAEYTTALVAMTTDEGSARPLGTVVDPDTWTSKPADFATWYGDITVAVSDVRTKQVATRYYRWASSAAAFVRVDT